MPIAQVKCYAKVNLGLSVSGRRADGYHELRTVFQTIALHDRLRIEVEKGAGVEVSCNLPELAGRSNLAARAAEAVLKELKARRRVRLALHKVIPISSGLGGGSSDAAAVLRALPTLLRRRLDPEQRLALAASLGADVPFFLIGGQALGLGRGVEVYPLPDPAPRPAVLVHPGVGISTAEAYRCLDEARQGQALTTPFAGHIMFGFCAAVALRRWDRLQNDFEPVVLSAYPQLARLKGFLMRAGASPALLTGSGSVMFGLFGTAPQARLAAGMVRRRWPQFQVWVTRTVTRRQLTAEWLKNEL